MPGHGNTLNCRYRKAGRDLILQFILKRRDTKKQIRCLELELLTVAKKYLQSSKKAQQDFLSQYENQIEKNLYHLVAFHLRLDPSWPHSQRWLDGLEEFTWARSSSVLSGKGELWWGYCANIRGAEVKEPCSVILGTARYKKKLLYRIIVGAGEGRRSFSNCK